MLWYDFAYNNPRNPNVRGFYRVARSTALFPTPASTARITLAPPLGRRFRPPHLYALCKQPVARSCATLLCWIEKTRRALTTGRRNNRRRACPATSLFPSSHHPFAAARAQERALPPSAAARRRPPIRPGKPSDTSYTLRRTMGTQEQQAVNNGTSAAKLAWTLGGNMEYVAVFSSLAILSILALLFQDDSVRR